MAKLPKKVTEEIKAVDMRQFVSSAAQMPGSASAVTRVNLTMTNDDLELAQDYQNEYGSSRADVIRAAMVALKAIPEEERRKMFDDIRKSSPKVGRPSIKK